MFFTEHDHHEKPHNHTRLTKGIEGARSRRRGAEHSEETKERLSSPTPLHENHRLSLLRPLAPFAPVAVGVRPLLQ